MGCLHRLKELHTTYSVIIKGRQLTGRGLVDLPSPSNQVSDQVSDLVKPPHKPHSRDTPQNDHLLAGVWRSRTLRNVPEGRGWKGQVSSTQAAGLDCGQHSWPSVEAAEVARALGSASGSEALLRVLPSPKTFLGG